MLLDFQQEKQLQNAIFMIWVEMLQNSQQKVMPNTSEPVVVRGGHYNTNGLAGRRLDYSTSIAYDYVGFRVTLFLN